LNSASITLIGLSEKVFDKNPEYFSAIQAGYIQLVARTDRKYLKLNLLNVTAQQLKQIAKDLKDKDEKINLP
jgi:ribosome recycling factor